jgi:hypothetical protein
MLLCIGANLPFRSLGTDLASGMVEVEDLRLDNGCGGGIGVTFKENFPFLLPAGTEFSSGLA